MKTRIALERAHEAERLEPASSRSSTRDRARSSAGRPRRRRRTACPRRRRAGPSRRAPPCSSSSARPRGASGRRGRRTPAAPTTASPDEVVGDDPRRVAELAHAPLVEPEAAVGERRDRGHVVADEQHRAPRARDLAHLAEALALERRVADREHLVDDQDLRLEVRGDGEREPQLHAARVALDGRVDEPLDLGELDDLVELALDLRAASCRGSRR